MQVFERQTMPELHDVGAAYGVAVDVAESVRDDYDTSHTRRTDSSRRSRASR